MLKVVILTNLMLNVYFSSLSLRIKVQCDVTQCCFPSLLYAMWFFGVITQCGILTLLYAMCFFGVVVRNAVFCVITQCGFLRDSPF